MAATAMKLQLVLVLVLLQVATMPVQPVSGCHDPREVDSCWLVFRYGPDPAFLSGCCGDIARDCVCDLLRRNDDPFSNAFRKAINTHCRFACR